MLYAQDLKSAFKTRSDSEWLIRWFKNSCDVKGFDSEQGAQSEISLRSRVEN